MLETNNGRIVVKSIGISNKIFFRLQYRFSGLIDYHKLYSVITDKVPYKNWVEDEFQQPMVRATRVSIDRMSLKIFEIAFKTTKSINRVTPLRFQRECNKEMCPPVRCALTSSQLCRKIAEISMVIIESEK